MKLFLLIFCLVCISVTTSQRCTRNNETYTTIAKPQKTKTAERCTAKCDKSPNCVSWTWNKKKKKCYLSKEFDLADRTPWISGNCGGPTTAEGHLFIGGGAQGEEFTSLIELSGHGQCTELTLPVGIMFHVSGLTHDGLILHCGGWKSIWNYLNDCQFYNDDTGMWENHSIMPDLRFASSIVMTENGTYILGGQNVSTTSIFLPIGTNNWTTGPEIPGAGVGGSCVLKLNSTHVIVIGGFYDFKQIRIWDIKSNTWTQLPDLPFGVWEQACIMTEEGVLVTGGYNADIAKVSDQTLIIDPQTRQTQTVGPMKTARVGHGMIIEDGRVIVVGGLNGTYQFVDYPEQYKEETWETAEKVLTTGRAYFNIVAVPDTVICN